MVWLVVIIGSLTGFLFGYDEGIIAGSLGLVKNHFSLTNAHVGLMTSALPFGALFGSMLIGALLATRLTKRLGRRPLLLLAGLLFFFGACGAATASGETMLVLSRFILGLAIGTAAVMTPLYLAESAPENLRGAMVAVYQLAITLGIFVAYIVNYLLLEQQAWRSMFASSAIPALIMVIGLLFLPESPRWLVSVGRRKEAEKNLKRLRRNKGVKAELLHIEKTLANEPKKSDWLSLFRQPLLPVLMLGMILFFLQQLCGINVIIYYAPEIFKNLGINNNVGQILATMGIGLVNMLVTIAAIFYVDKIGRRKLLILGFAGTFLSLATLSLASYFSIAFLSYLSILCLSLYIFSFAISIGPIPHISMAEIFPLHVRGAGMGLSSMSNWGFNTLTVFSFPLLQEAFGIELTFGLYAFVCLLGLFYARYYMPETKGLSLEDIEDYLMSGQPLRYLGREKPAERKTSVVFPQGIPTT